MSEVLSESDEEAADDGLHRYFQFIHQPQIVFIFNKKHKNEKKKSFCTFASCAKIFPSTKPFRNSSQTLDCRFKSSDDGFQKRFLRKEL